VRLVTGRWLVVAAIAAALGPASAGAGTARVPAPELLAAIADDDPVRLPRGYASFEPQAPAGALPLGSLPPIGTVRTSPNTRATSASGCAGARSTPRSPRSRSR